jgi:desulfoferrodoxin-like iron-binding protein
MKWKCINCQNELQAKEPPEICPVCNARCAYTDGIGLDYAPKPGRGFRNGVIFACEICGTTVQVIEDKGGVLMCCGEAMKQSGD